MKILSFPLKCRKFLHFQHIQIPWLLIFSPFNLRIWFWRGSGMSTNLGTGCKGLILLWRKFYEAFFKQTFDTLYIRVDTQFVYQHDCEFIFTDFNDFLIDYFSTSDLYIPWDSYDYGITLMNNFFKKMSKNIINFITPRRTK